MNPGLRFPHAAMDTVFEIVFARSNSGNASTAQAAFAELDRLERELSRFIPTSSVSRANSLKPGRTAVLEADAAACLALAQEARRVTGGAFDVTAGGPRRPLRFDPARRRLRGTGARIDFGGIGKGYALDAMAALLNEWGAGPALLHAGQSTALAFRAREGSWTLRLRSPSGGARSIGVIRLARGAVSGSAAGIRGAHIIVPSTGRPPARASSRGAWASAPTAAFADALSTAFFVSSPSRIRRICAANPGISGLLLQGLRVASFGRGAGVRFLPNVG